MNQRLRQIIDRLKNERKVYTDADFARLAEVSRSELSQMLTGKRPVSKRIVNTLLTEFPEISEEWLRTGEGDMLNLAYSHDVSPTVLADDHSTAIAGNKNVVNADQTIAMLVAEVSAQRRLTEKVLEQNSELLAIVAGRK
jgi:plasmid maintenance system antidote protein VapI